jgi:outer membrane protein assembly factor BamB
MKSFGPINYRCVTGLFAGALALGLAACSSDKATPPVSAAPGTPAGAAPTTPAAGAAGAASPATTGPSTARPMTTPTGNAPMTTPGTGMPSTPGDVPSPGLPSGGPTDMPGTPPTMTASPDWTRMGYDLGSTYNNIGETKISKESVKNLKEIWTADMGGNVLGAALMIGDKMYATAPASVRAFEAATGKELWQAPANSSSSLAYESGTLYVHTTAAKVTAINAEDGKELWSKDASSAGGDGSSSPLVMGDMIFIGASSGGNELGGGGFRGHVSGLNRMTGDNAWTTFTVPEGTNGAAIWSSPSGDLERGKVYVGTGNNYGMPASDTSDAIIEFDMKTGTISWKAQFVKNDTFGGGSLSGGPDYDFGANPVLYETMIDGVMTKMISDGAKSGSAHGIKREDGSTVWTRSMCEGTADGSRGIFTNAAWTGKNMLYACNEGGPATLYALDGATGDIAWMRKLEGQVWGRTAVANGVGFVGTGTKLEVFDVDTGEVLKTVMSKGGTIASTITVSNGRVAFGEGLSWSSGMAGSKLTVLSVE